MVTAFKYLTNYMKKLLFYLICFFALIQAKAQFDCYQPDSVKKTAGLLINYRANSTLNFEGTTYTKFYLEFTSKNGSKFSYEKSCQLILCDQNGASIKVPCTYKENEFTIIKGTLNKKAQFELKARMGVDPGQVVLYGPLLINNQIAIEQIDFYLQN
jgi:hypothetical protein